MSIEDTRFQKVLELLLRIENRVLSLEEEKIDKSYDMGYEKGARAAIDTVSNWLDEDTVDELKARFLREEEE